MSLDLTNGDRLDVSPIVERKSNIVTLSSSAKPISTTLQTKPVQPIAVAPTLAIPSPNTQAQAGSVGISIPRRINIAQSITPRTISQVAAPTGTTPSGTTSSGTSIPRLASPQSQSQSQSPSASPSASPSGASPSDTSQSGTPSEQEQTTDAGSKTVEEKTEVTSVTKPDAKKGMLWIVGLVVGGIGGYFMGKKQNKVLTYSLIGAGIGGGIGFFADKYMGKESGLKKGKSTTSESTTTNSDEFANKMIDTMRLFIKSLSGGTGDKEFNEQIEKQRPAITKGIKDAFAKLNDKEKPAIIAWVDFQLDKLKNYNEATFEKESKEKKDELNKKFGVDVEEIYNRFSKEIQVK